MVYLIDPNSNNVLCPTLCLKCSWLCKIKPLYGIPPDTI